MLEAHHVSIGAAHEAAYQRDFDRRRKPRKPQPKKQQGESLPSLIDGILAKLRDAYAEHPQMCLYTPCSVRGIALTWQDVYGGGTGRLGLVARCWSIPVVGAVLAELSRLRGAA